MFSPIKYQYSHVQSSQCHPVFQRVTAELLSSTFVRQGA